MQRPSTPQRPGQDNIQRPAAPVVDPSRQRGVDRGRSSNPVNTSRDLSPARVPSVRDSRPARNTNIKVAPARTTPTPLKDSWDQPQSRSQRGSVGSAAGKSSLHSPRGSSRIINDSKWSAGNVNSSDFKSPSRSQGFTNVPVKPSAAFVDSAVVAKNAVAASSLVITDGNVDCVPSWDKKSWDCDDDDWSFHFGLSIGFGHHWWLGFDHWDPCWPHSSLAFHFFSGCDTWCGPSWCGPSHGHWHHGHNYWWCDDFWWPHSSIVYYRDYSDYPPIGPAITLADAWSYLAEGSFSRAEDAFGDLLIVGVGGEEARVGYSIVLTLTGREDAAAAAMRRALNDDPQAILYVPADSRLRWPLEAFADLWADRAAANRDDFDALFMLASAHLMLGEDADGYFAIDQAIRAGDMDASAQNLKRLLERAMDQRLNRGR